MPNVKLILVIESGWDFDENNLYVLPREKGDFNKIVELQILPRSGESIVIKELEQFEGSFRIARVRHHVNDIAEVLVKVSDQSSLGDELHCSVASKRREIEKILLSNKWKKS